MEICKLFSVPVQYPTVFIPEEWKDAFEVIFDPVFTSLYILTSEKCNAIIATMP